METLKIDDAQSHFMRIPPEVRWQILKILRQPVAMNARLVCRQLRDEIDNSYKVSIIFDDGNLAHRNRLSQLYIKEIIIVEQTVEMPHFLPESSRQCVETVEIRGPISRENLHCYMFSYFGLKKFVLNYDLQEEKEKITEMQQIYEGSTIKRQSGLGLAFQKTLNVLILKAKIIRYSSEVERCLNEEYSSLSSFLRFTYPRLKEFELTLRVPVSSSMEIQHLVLDFIRRHSATLKKTMLTIFQAKPLLPFDYSDSETFPVGNSTLVKREMFQRLELKTLVLNLSHTLNISQILNYVSKVERFTGNIYNQTPSFYDIFIQNNYQTLKILKLARLSTSKLTPFSCSILCECIQLEQLVLDNEYLFHLSSEWNSLTYPEIVELEALPKSLRLLEIFWFRIKSHSIRKMLVKMTSLKHLVLRYVGSRDDLGVTPSILKQILKNSSIYYFSITNCNVAVETQDETDMLKEIMEVCKDEYDTETNSITFTNTFKKL